jgi:hypothetical protein
MGKQVSKNMPSSWGMGISLRENMKRGKKKRGGVSGKEERENTGTYGRLLLKGYVSSKRVKEMGQKGCKNIYIRYHRRENIYFRGVGGG